MSPRTLWRSLPVDVRRFTAACTVGAGTALSVLSWFALRGTSALLARTPVGNFYEVQARALFHGHWDVPPDALSFERFRVGGRFYAYFGPWPSFLRMPVLLVTDRFDGRLTRLSVILACALLLAAVSRLAWLARKTLRPDIPLARGELLAAAAFVFVAGCGSLVVYLAGWAAVYHEAILWGVAWTLVSVSCIVAHLTGGPRRNLPLAAGAAALAMLSRGSVGLGAVVALGLLLAAELVRRWRARRRGVDNEHRRHLAVLAACFAIPLVLHAYVNMVKFGSPLGVPPIDKQDLLADWPTRAPALEANGGSLFGPVYSPTIIVQYLRPDAISTSHAFPWVGFSGPPKVLGGAVFEALNPSTSIPATSTLLFGLAAAGATLATRRRGRIVRIPLLGTAVGCAGAVSLGFVDQRYQGDFLPFVLVAAAFGLWWAIDGAHARRDATRWAIVTAAALAGVWSCWANGGLSFVYQRAYYPYVTTDDRAALVALQLDTADRLGLEYPSQVRRGNDPGMPGAADALFVQGSCEAVLWSDGREWHPVETTPSTGLIRARLDGPPRSEQVLVTTTDARGSGTVRLVAAGAGRLRTDYRWEPAIGVDEATGHLRGRPMQSPAEGAEVVVHLDRRGRFSSQVVVEIAGRRVLAGEAPLSLGRPELGPDVAPLPVSTPICDRLRDLR